MTVHDTASTLYEPVKGFDWSEDQYKDLMNCIRRNSWFGWPHDDPHGTLRELIQPAYNAMKEEYEQVVVKGKPITEENAPFFLSLLDAGAENVRMYIVVSS